MTPQRHAQAKHIFLGAVQLPADQRGPWLDKACAGDPSLRGEVEALLNQLSADSIQSREASRQAAEQQSNMPTRVNFESLMSSSAQPVPVRSISGDAHTEDTEPQRTPGTMIAERYRIVSPLGVGGMGIVYRADDLTLNQTVAMKFLTPVLATNPLWLARLRNEARLARTVTHPNVCRVFDVGQGDGEAFITMEFVPGEDLASLLRRIDRLSAEKALEVACQICSGLAAAHRVGVLHRDLKPANIMLDAEGNVRITDFGLAAVSGHIATKEIRAGTPAYMAPEQIAGREVTWRSDIYSLGLVMYELFSGSRAYSATTFQEYVELHEHTTPRPLSDLVTGLPHAVEEVISRCLEKQPEDRPRSALHVAAALPGVDVLHMALASGVTPLPDLIAAAPARSGTPRKRGVLLIASLVLLVALTALRSLYPLQWDDLGTNDPSALAERARHILEETGLSMTNAHESFGFSTTEDASLLMGRAFDHEDVAANVVPAFPLEPCFFYRQSDRPFLPSAVENVFWRAGYATPDDPPLADAHARAILLDKDGQLILLGSASITQTPSSSTAAITPFDQVRDGLLRAAGVTSHQSQASVAKRESKSGNELCAYHDLPGVQGTVNSIYALCSSANRPTYFSIGSQPNAAVHGTTARLGVAARQQRTVIFVQRVLFLLLIVAAVPVGIAKSHTTRVDYQGAVRLAVVVALLEFSAASLRLGNAVSIFDAVSQLAMAVVRGAGMAGILGVSYLAIDAYARRLWPHLLITWNRLLLGRLRDPDVSFHALVGVCVGCWWSLAKAAERMAVNMAGWQLAPMFSAERIAEKLHGVSSALASHLATFELALVYGLLFMLLLVVIRRLVRHPAWAAVLCALVLMPVVVPRGANPYTAWLALGLGGVAVCVWIMMRYGLLAVTVALLVSAVLNTSPMNFGTRAWTMGISMSALAIVVGLIAYGFLWQTSGSAKRDHPNFRSI